MPAPTITTGDPCWIDLFTSDPGQAGSFYGALFGWTAESAGVEYGGYVNFAKDGVPVAGAMRNDGSTGQPDVWSVYLATDDARAAVDAATRAGGTPIVPAMDVMDLGTMAVVADASGATIGIWQPAAHRGFGLLAEPGAPSWFELHTRDHDRAVAFYRTAFGWDTSIAIDEPGFRYTTLGEGDDARAGIMDATPFLHDGAPSTWSVYFGVADVDATLAQAERLGGAVVAPAEDTPYGRVATLCDPTGAVFKIRG